MQEASADKSLSYTNYNSSFDFSSWWQNTGYILVPHGLVTLHLQANVRIGAIPPPSRTDMRKSGTKRIRNRCTTVVAPTTYVSAIIASVDVCKV